MKRQLVKKTVINKRTLLFYRLESGSYTLVVERSGMSWGSFLTRPGCVSVDVLVAAGEEGEH